ncbi:hypothetical protein BBO99_00004943 [Phytophthora kernoviae]|uniref:EF-hand domain-containing protein n=2 Tax=Phytophthora kernoviae TaxID=325452 RepID=A0A3R7K1C4_9STRA|nr:hypothetical protein G195_005402 [Phytophthora kernoviae 00238/432]KAG2527206.1 hypothetical protein JM18_003959 [Phytophthora kernoviae]RLM97631.1 hypothetical protein BBI17_004988 [Phytophthora kernoviae]RLN79881.1 hypothetical protein BBO99_00004943 [Phytophthora kernoviae]
MPGKDGAPTENISSAPVTTAEKDAWDISRLNKHWEIDMELRRSLPALARTKRTENESPASKFLRLSKLPLPSSLAPDPLLMELATPLRCGRTVSQRAITVTSETKAKYFGRAAKSECYTIFRQLAAQKYLTLEPLSEFLTTQGQNTQHLDAREEDTTPAGTGVPLLSKKALSKSLNDNDTTSKKNLGASSRSVQRSSGGSILNGEPFTARHKFSALCLERDLPPCIRLITRQYFSPEINVSHMAIGDDLACVFAACLLDLPMVTGLNARNNRLRDRGLEALVDVVVSKPDLFHLDLSENKVDRNAAQALAAYLGSACCKLQTLRLASADVDDDELVPFARALHTNKSLQTLDVSRNSVGSSEHLNVVRPSVTTGGEALATMLSINNTLTSLDLSWNYLRLSGAVEIGRALAYNSGLRELNLAYNALGNAGAQAVGDALLSNTTLRHLDMSHNNIPAQGALAIASALKTNIGLPLTQLSLGGNPLGSMGGRALLHAVAACAVSKKLSISLEECNFDAAVGGEGSFDPADPTGSYDLNMEVPYERAIALELLRVANTKQGCKFLSIVHTSSVNKQRRNIRVELREIQEGVDARRKLLKTAGILTDAQAPSDRELVSRSLDRKSLEELFHELDKDESGFIDEHELRAGMRKLGIQFRDEDVPRYVALYDLDGTGTIELDEFVELMESFNLDEVDSGFARECVDLDTNQPFEVPLEGRLQLDFVDLHVAAGRDSANSEAGVERLVENIRASKDKTQMLFMAKTGLVFNSHEAQLLVEAVCDVCDASQAVTALLPHMTDCRNAYALMERNLSSSDRLRVQHLMGQALQPILGLATGHYRIDLANDLDRITLRKLVENSNRTAFLRKKGGLKDTSQHVNYHGFRNEVLHGKSIVLEPKFLDTAPHFGYLELDYVQLGRSPAHPLSTKRFEQMLQLCQFARMGPTMGVATTIAASPTSKLGKNAWGGKTSVDTPPSTFQTSGTAALSVSPFPPQRSFTKRVFEEYEKMNTLRNYVEFGAGMLNVLTTLWPDNYYELALARYEEREFAKALVRLAIDEPGENWLNETFGWSRDEKIPGWELNYSWLKDGGFPEKGYLSLEYYSGADKGCGPLDMVSLAAKDAA